MISINHRARKYRLKAKEKLNSPEGIEKRKKRSIDVEAVFGHIKECRGFRRYTLRLLKGVSIETGLLSIAHNLIKLHKRKMAQINLEYSLLNP